MATKSNCCRTHGDIPSLRSVILQGSEKFELRAGPNAPVIPISAGCIAVTGFWINSFGYAYVKQKLGTLHFTTNNVCKNHQRKTCNKGEGCHWVHICRELWPVILRSLHTLQSKAIHLNPHQIVPEAREGLLETPATKASMPPPPPPPSQYVLIPLQPNQPASNVVTVGDAGIILQCVNGLQHHQTPQPPPVMVTQQRPPPIALHTFPQNAYPVPASPGHISSPPPMPMSSMRTTISPPPVRPVSPPTSMRPMPSPPAARPPSPPMQAPAMHTTMPPMPPSPSPAFQFNPTVTIGHSQKQSAPKQPTTTTFIAEEPSYVHDVMQEATQSAQSPKMKHIEDMLATFLGIGLTMDIEFPGEIVPLGSTASDAPMLCPCDSPEPASRAGSQARKPRRRSSRQTQGIQGCALRKYSEPESSPGPSEGESSDEDQHQTPQSGDHSSNVWEEKMKASRGKFRNLRGGLLGIQMAEGPNERPAFAAGRGCRIIAN